MKILLISGFFPPTHIAGSEKRTMGYAKALHAAGHEVQVLSAGSFDSGAQYWNATSDEIYQGIAVRRVHLNWKLAPDPNRYLYENPIVASRLEKWISDWKPDVAHVISCYTLSGSVIDVLKRRTVPVVLTLVDFWFVCPRLSLQHADGSLCDGRTTAWECQRCLLWGAKAYRWPRRFLPENAIEQGIGFISKHPVLSRQRGLAGMALDMEQRKQYLPSVLQKADFVTAPSQVLADMVSGAGIDITVEVIHSGHDLSWLAGMPPREHSAVIRFGYIGHIHPAKGVYELVEAFLKADFDRDEARLSVYGDTDKDAGYMRRIKTLLASRKTAIDFCGAFAPARLGEVLAEIDVVVVPSSWWENNPRVVQEAFASRAPVIASDVPGIAEFVQDEVNGLLFQRGSMRDLMFQMQRIVKEPQLLPQLRTGITPVKTVEQEIAELTAIYKQTLGQEVRA